MKKKPSSSARSPSGGRDLFSTMENRRRRALFLPRFLGEEAKSNLLRGKKQDRAYEILRKWADLETKGHLDKKETALDASFLHEVFGEALGYQTATQRPENYQLERNFTVHGIGTADGALGLFAPRIAPSPVAVIELKGAKIDLDRDKSNGRTAVQQCWDYLNALPDCPWGIVSWNSPRKVDSKLRVFGLFVLRWGNVAQRRVTTLVVVEHLEVLDERRPRHDYTS